MLVRDHRPQRFFRQRAVADVAALGAAHEAGLTHRERREVVMMDVALGVLEAEAVDALVVADGAQRQQRHRLGLAAGEERRTVRAGRDSDLDR